MSVKAQGNEIRNGSSAYHQVIPTCFIVPTPHRGQGYGEVIQIPLAPIETSEMSSGQSVQLA